MRLNKRIAAGILAAAMSMTLLAGCGGGAASSSPATGNQPGNGSASSSTSTGNTGTNGNTSSSGTNSASSETSKDTVAVLWQKSKTYQYAKMLKGSKISMDTVWNLISEDDSEEVEYVYEQEGATSYVEVGQPGGEKAKVLVANNWAYVFMDEGDQKICAKTDVDDFKQQELAESMGTLKTMLEEILNVEKPVSFTSGVKKVGNGTYNAETFVRSEAGVKIEVTCYYSGDKLEQVTFNAPTVKATIRVNRLTASPNRSVFELPSGYRVVSYDKDGNIYDENGEFLGNINRK